MKDNEIGPLYRVRDDLADEVGGIVLQYMGKFPATGAAVMVAADMLGWCCHHGQTGTTPDCGTFRPDLSSVHTKELLNALPEPILDITKKLEGKKITRDVFMRWVQIIRMYLEHPGNMARA